MMLSKSQRCFGCRLCRGVRKEIGILHPGFSLFRWAALNIKGGSELRCLQRHHDEDCVRKWPAADCRGRAEHVCSAPEVRPQPVLLSRGRRRPRCRDIERYSQSCYAPEGAVRLAGCRFGDRPRSPWSDEGNASRTGAGPVRRQRSSEIGVGHTGGSSYVRPSRRETPGCCLEDVGFAEDECRKRKRPRIDLSTSELQREALSLYRACGYQLVREEVVNSVSNKTVGGGIRRYHFTKEL